MASAACWRCEGNAPLFRDPFFAGLPYNDNIGVCRMCASERVEVLVRYRMQGRDVQFIDNGLGH